jgi:hypothetical protein
MIKIQPYFDIELFLQTANETRLGRSDMDTCLSLWEEWTKCLSCKEVADNAKTYLAMWLSSDVENTVETAWKKSPSEGFRLNALAQTLSMCAVQELIPEIEDIGCAPFPHASPTLASAISEAGLPARTGAGGGLEFGRNFAMVTRYPFSGGCEVCSLLSSCPRAGSGDSFIELG